jgi:DNA-binding CsgD family transcriptional regulator
VDNLNELTPRETEAVRLLTFTDHTTDRAIAGVMGVKPRTVERHMEVAREKTGCRNRIELIRWGRENLKQQEISHGN